MTKINVRFKWLEEHDRCFNKLLEAFKADALLQYFDINKQIYIFRDAHMTGLGAMLAQGDTIGEARPIAFASRTTSDAEKRYAQIDLEGLGVDFGLRRFRNYTVGSPKQI